MILVFVTNEQFGEVRDLSFEGRVSYRNPKYIDRHYKPEKCDAVYIHGNYPEIEKRYKGKLLNFDSKTSKDYTIAELRDMKDQIEDWQAFTDGDNRKSIHQI